MCIRCLNISDKTNIYLLKLLERNGQDNCN